MAKRRCVPYPYAQFLKNACAADGRDITAPAQCGWVPWNMHTPAARLHLLQVTVECIASRCITIYRYPCHLELCAWAVMTLDAWQTKSAEWQRVVSMQSWSSISHLCEIHPTVSHICYRPEQRAVEKQSEMRLSQTAQHTNTILPCNSHFTFLSHTQTL